MKAIAKLLKNKDEAQTDFRLSVSKAKTFDDCKAKFKFSYIDRLPKKDWDFHIFGKFMHQVLENFHRDLLDHPERKSMWQQRLRVAWEGAADEYKSQMKDSQWKEAEDIMKVYGEILEEEGLPNVTGVEESFAIELDGKVLLNGFIDRVQLDPDGLVHVADYKTTKDKKYLKDYFQLQTYSFALMLKNPSIQKIRASFIMLRSDFDFLTEEYTREEIMEKIPDTFIKYSQDIEDEKTWRPNPQFLCKYCDFLDHCPEGNNYLVKKGIIEGKPKTIKVGLTKW